MPAQACISLQILIQYMSFDRENTIIILLLSLCIVLWFFYTYIANSLYIQSYPLVQVQRETKQLHDENMLLKDHLLEKESYTRIASEAAKMGLTVTASPIYLK